MKQMKSEPCGLSQRAVHPGLPARPAGLEPGHHVLIEAQRDGNLGVFDLGPSAHVPAHGVGQGRKRLCEGPGLGELRRCGLRGIRIAGDHPLDLVFGQMGLAHSRLRSLALAGRIEITDTPWVPKAAKTTATVPSARRPIAMCRPAFAGTTTEANTGQGVSSLLGPRVGRTREPPLGGCFQCVYNSKKTK